MRLMDVPREQEAWTAYIRDRQILTCSTQLTAPERPAKADYLILRRIQ
jgi:hypothetical protein